MHLSHKVVIKNKDGKLLALRRSATDPSRPLTWDLAGGQVEEGENLEDSARREILEEAGLEVGRIRFIHADARRDNDGTYWVALFSAAAAQTEDVQLSYEHDQYEWISREEFAARKSSARIEALLQSDIEF